MVLFVPHPPPTKNGTPPKNCCTKPKKRGKLKKKRSPPPPMALLLLSASVERFSVSRMQDFFFCVLCKMYIASYSLQFTLYTQTCVFIPSPVREGSTFLVIAGVQLFRTELKSVRKVSADASLKRF